MSDNNNIICVSGYERNDDLHRLQVLLASFGHVRFMREVMLRERGNQSVIVAEYFDVRGAAAAKEFLDGSTFQQQQPASPTSPHTPLSSLSRASPYATDTTNSPVTPLSPTKFTWPASPSPSQSHTNLSSPNNNTATTNSNTNINSSNNANTNSATSPNSSNDQANTMNPEQLSAFTEVYFNAAAKAAAAAHHAAHAAHAHAAPTPDPLRQAAVQPSLSLPMPKGFGRDGPIPSGNELCLWHIARGLDLRTTFMIRNIPNKYTQKMLIDTINETHRGQYDFLYLRMDFRNHCNVGYAFINFIDPRSVISFAMHHVGRRWNRFNSDKICRISYANIQGKQSLIDKFRNSSVMEKDASYRPKIFYSYGPLRGLEEPFPMPNPRVTTRLTSSSNESINELPSPRRLTFPSRRHQRDQEDLMHYGSAEPSPRQMTFQPFADMI
ncbi:RNA recognition motif 2-domain-containing protein [Syncephalis pseudoplumigaleata]|uniref:RNA recognition motif 2-domain-containing protein n=1 Tax=Syncephalis pseudoplumigaleata TaxID=1712513 RepID=A0A4P9Z0A6_9FUNG|nr:RNA recognition motif 2-domain-containing protein [Syncephalis pseudoplumigaleata]|eukprot:RKP25121.1 RNA recognition motif 2-domain-containing protein [Syncephalis pseudoplumigaleata]